MSAKIDNNSQASSPRSNPKKSSEAHLGKQNSKANPCHREPLSSRIPFSSSHPSQPLKHRISPAKGVHHIERVQEKALKTPHFDSLTLLKLAKQLDKFSKASDSNHDFIKKDTLALLPKEAQSRLYFHLYLLHASKGKKTDYHYGEKAFKGSDGHTATHKERATAIHNLLLEQLASRFSSLGHQNSEGLMKCFAALPKKDRDAIYFHAFQLSASSGNKAFHRKDHPVETNLLRGQAIYRHLLKRLNSESSHLPPDLQKEIHQLRKDCGLLKKTVITEKETAQQAKAAKQELQENLKQLTIVHGVEQEAHKTVKTELAEKTEALEIQKTEAEQTHNKLNAQLNALKSRHALRIRILTAKYKKTLETHDKGAAEIEKELEKSLRQLEVGHKSQAQQIRFLLSEVQNKKEQVETLTSQVSSLSSKVETQALRLKTANAQIRQLTFANQKNIEELTAAHRTSQQELLKTYEAQQQGKDLYRKKRLEAKKQEPAPKVAHTDKAGENTDAHQRALAALSLKVEELSKALLAEKAVSDSAKRESLASKEQIQTLQSEMLQQQQALQKKLRFKEGALQIQLRTVKGLQSTAANTTAVHQNEMLQVQQAASEQITKLRQTMRQLRQKSSTDQEQNQKLSSELDTLRAANLTAQQTNQRKIDSLNAQLKELTTACNEFEKDSVQTRSSLQKKGSEFEKLSREHESLKSQMAKTSADLSTSKKEEERLKNELEALGKEFQVCQLEFFTSNIKLENFIHNRGSKSEPVGDFYPQRGKFAYVPTPDFDRALNKYILDDSKLREKTRKKTSS